LRKRRLGSLVVLPALLAALAAGGCRRGVEKTYEFQAPGLTWKVDGSGAVSGVAFTGPNEVRSVRAFTRLRDCEPAGRLEVLGDGTRVKFQRKWVSLATGDSCLVSDRFSPGRGLRWRSMSSHWGCPDDADRNGAIVRGP
jgi:hypothetical protein